MALNTRTDLVDAHICDVGLGECAVDELIAVLEQLGCGGEYGGTGHQRGSEGAEVPLIAWQERRKAARCACRRCRRGGRIGAGGRGR